MEDLLKKILVPIKDIQEIRGIAMPIGLEYLQLVVTGPPGAGKSYYINQIRGWPNEGYIDLTRKGWWRDQSLIYRPREVHLGMPFKGYKEAFTVFDKEWLDISPPPPLELSRVRIPPGGDSIFRTNYINRYIFEFLLPDPEVIYERRKARQIQGYFPVDSDLTIEMVNKQNLAYQEMALYMHRAGINVYIRKGLDGPPMRIAEKGVAAVPRWAITKKPPRPSLKNISGWKEIFGLRQSNWFTITHDVQRITGVNRIAHDGKTFEMLLGDQRLCFHPELPLGIKRKEMKKNWIINTPLACSTMAPSGFVRIKNGETVILGRSNKEYDDILRFSKKVAKRHVAITNSRGDLTITPLEEEIGVKLVRFDNLDYRERVQANRYKAFISLRQLFGGSITLLPPDIALDRIRKVNELMDAEPMRPLTSEGKAGGIVDLQQRAVPVIVGDLHAQVDNLLKILSENCLIGCLRSKSATLVLLGDAIHSEILEEMEDMDSSILMMDLIFTLKLRFPENFFYLRGNHDSFSADISKNGISQGILMKERLRELRGQEYVDEMETYYSKLPYIIKSPYFYACHAAPPRSDATLDDLINIANNPILQHEITKNRLQRPHYLSGYNKSDIKRFRKTLDMPKGVPFVVGHTPLDPFGSIWKNVGTIKNHHIIFSAHQEGATILQQIKDDLIPLSYPAEPLTKLINDLE
ncbi:metallophosphoesterase [Desulfosediminicola flagellatus]|uniref:metallophosphoesterase n=1 Tax=Desulfosediminicola flagellatus TaxID=2569541 RepID=UPI0010ACD1D0|nr:metallophosphoesterase [Desulfosediminicola flagellatus]